MELATLLSKTKHSIADLAQTEFRFLSFLLARVNRGKIPTHGYLAWPGIDMIIEYTALGDTTIQKVRKTLKEKGYLQIVSGKGPKSSNHYYINAQKIIDGAVKSGENAPKYPAAPTVIESQEESKKQHKRNTIGLMIGKDKPEVVQKPVDKPISKPIIIQDDEDPFGGYIAPNKIESVKSLGKNPDGSDPFFPNGERRYSYDDVMNLLVNDPDCPF